MNGKAVCGRSFKLRQHPGPRGKPSGGLWNVSARRSGGPVHAGPGDLAWRGASGQTTTSPPACCDRKAPAVCSSRNSMPADAAHPAGARMERRSLALCCPPASPEVFRSDVSAAHILQFSTAGGLSRMRPEAPSVPLEQPLPWWSIVDPNPTALPIGSRAEDNGAGTPSVFRPWL